MANTHTIKMKTSDAKAEEVDQKTIDYLKKHRLLDSYEVKELKKVDRPADSYEVKELKKVDRPADLNKSTSKEPKADEKAK